MLSAQKTFLFEALLVLIKKLNKWNLENRMIHENSPPKALIPDLYDPWWRGERVYVRERVYFVSVDYI